MPDLTFSEMRFLQRQPSADQVDVDKPSTKKKGKRRNKIDKRQDKEKDMSTYFAGDRQPLAERSLDPSPRPSRAFGLGVCSASLEDKSCGMLEGNSVHLEKSTASSRRSQPPKDMERALGRSSNAQTDSDRPITKSRSGHEQDLTDSIAPYLRQGTAIDVGGLQWWSRTIEASAIDPKCSSRSDAHAQGPPHQSTVAATSYAFPVMIEHHLNDTIESDHNALQGNETLPIRSDNHDHAVFVGANPTTASSPLKNALEGCEGSIPRVEKRVAENVIAGVPWLPAALVDKPYDTKVHSRPRAGPAQIHRPHEQFIESSLGSQPPLKYPWRHEGGINVPAATPGNDRFEYPWFKSSETIQDEQQHTQNSMAHQTWVSNLRETEDSWPNPSLWHHEHLRLSHERYAPQDRDGGFLQSDLSMPHWQGAQRQEQLFQWPEDRGVAVQDWRHRSSHGQTTIGDETRDPMFSAHETGQIRPFSMTEPTLDDDGYLCDAPDVAVDDEPVRGIPEGFWRRNRLY